MDGDGLGTWSVELEVRPVLSYAMAHNGVPVVSRAVVHGARTDTTVRLSLGVTDATGPIGAPTGRDVAVRADEPAVVTDLDLRLDAGAVLQIEERRPGRVHATVELDGAVVATHDVAVTLLAAHQWRAEPLALSMEMLAAHVMPNHPAIGVLMRETATVLGQITGSTAIQGYQSGPERVDQIVVATFLVMHARGIAYSMPPASWADDGQKVRNPDEVLNGRVGTCLDTVVVMAAALEHAGIHPLLWLIHGHAFLGYWREPLSFASTVELDAASAVNQVDLGTIGLIETTALTGDEGPDALVASMRSAREHLHGDLGHVDGVVDVRRARKDSVLPLPARVRDVDGAVQVVIYAPPTPVVATPAPVRPAADGARRGPAPAEPPRVTRWKNALLDLSLRNRLINFTDRGALSLMLPDGGAGPLEDLLHQGTAVTLRASDEITRIAVERGARTARDLGDQPLAELLHHDRSVHVDVTAAAYPTRLRGLAHKARTITDETGANNLYLALGTLVWDLDGRTLRSPLILVPVVLRPARRGGRYRLSLDESGTSTPNYCLVEKLRQTHGLTIPGLADPAEDGAGIDLDAAFDATRRAIAERGLNFRVEPTADISILQFAKFRLWKDLDENWSTFAANPLVAHLVHTPTEPFADPVLDPGTHDLDGLDERCPVPADASQLRAVADAVAGRTFVLEGPPGTGKSQTITNLLAHAVSEGRRVLFVAEKRAALDVVQKRLDAVGLGPLCLDLHDKGSKPIAVRQRIAAALDHTVAVDPVEHEARLEETRAARRALTRYAYRLGERNGAGMSLPEARSAELAHADADALAVPEAVAAADAETTATLRRVLGRLPGVADVARPRPGHPWGFVDVSAGVDPVAVAAAAARLDAAVPHLPARLRPCLDAAVTPGELELLGRLTAQRTPLPVLDEVRSPRWSAAVEGALAGIDRLRGEPHPVLGTVRPAALDLPLADLDREARAAAASGLLGRKKRLAAVGARLTPVLRPGVVPTPKQVPELVAQLLVLRERVDAAVAALGALPGVGRPPHGLPYVDAARAEVGVRIDRLRWAATVVDPAVSTGMRPAFVEPLRRALAAGAADPAPVFEAAAAGSALVAACRCTPEALAGWAGATGLVPRWWTARAERGPVDGRAPVLRAWLDLVGLVEPLRATLPEVRIRILEGRLDPDEARRSFELGLARASVRERLRSTELDRFDPAAHDRSIHRFGLAGAAVREHLVSHLPHRVLGTRDFDAGATAGRIGALRRALGARRGGMRIRELMSTHGDLITRALPCVLVSPDSLSRFFPAEADLFDVVVFDEASQVRVADAVGAMGRARSVVVVGDSKQMPPTSFADTGGGPDDEAADPVETVDDEESILTECVQARVPSQRLGWHYRSQDEALIAFSNRHYYDGALSSFPAPERGTAAVSLVRVDGDFHRSGRGPLLRTNPIEARAVVDDVVRRFAASPDALPSLGVVTFNQQQRAHIEGLLRDLDDPRIVEALEAPEGLFVKNLENVQGDERDTILFSTGFGVNDRGVLPLNFGPLNRAGGERRLNVAVTRARRQVVVFTSFDPSQMRTEETSSVGVRHLRTYLELAANGPSALPRDRERPAVRDRHRDEIADRLRARGLRVRTGVGLSDFTIDLVVSAPGAPAGRDVAVLLDGASWSRRLTVRDRDHLPVEVLHRVLGWARVERVWLPQWLTAPDAVLDALAAAADQAARVPSTGPDAETTVRVPAQAPAAPEPAQPPPDGGRRRRLEPDGRTPVIAAAAPAARTGSAWPGDATEFAPWHPRRLGGRDVLDALPDRAAADLVRRAIGEVVTAEGPVRAERLASLVANAFDLTKVNENRREQILRHVPPELRRDRVEDVVWPAGVDPEAWTRYRPAGESSPRRFTEVPLREIGNAMAALVAAGGGMERAELHGETLRVFGLLRRTQAAVERLDTALELSRGRYLDVDEHDMVRTLGR